MQNLSEILKQLQQKYSKIEETSLAEVVKQIANDEDVRHFWAENQTKLRQDAFQLKMMDLHEFVQQKERISRGEKSLYPGYYPQLAIEKGYPHVRYVADESTQKQLMQAEKLTSYKMPKAIRDADLQTIVVDSGRANVVTAIVDILTQLLKKDDAYVQGLYLYGEFGVGKTYLMGALANALAANNIDVMLVHFPSFAVDLKNTIGKNSDVREKLIMQTKTTTVLILDEIGRAHV